MSVSLSPLGGAGWQFFTDDGIPLAGGRIYTYAAGTTTPAATYNSSTGAGANTNPIILDSAGRPSAEIWLSDSIIYKFVVKTPADILIRTYDNIPGMASPISITSLLGPNGASLVGYSEGSSGSVTQTVQSRLRNDWVVPEDFGATGNGVTDDTIALQNALASGKDVMLTAGKIYLHTSSLIISTNKQRIMGGGTLRTSGAIDSFQITGDDVELDVIFNSPGQTSGWAIYALGADRCKIWRAIIQNGYGALYVEQTNTFVVDYLWAETRGPGIKLYGDTSKISDRLSINFAVINPGNTEYGFNWDGNCKNIQINYLNVIGAKGAIIQNTSGGTAPSNGRINHCRVSGSSTHGLEITSGTDYDIIAPSMVSCAGDGIRIGSAIAANQVRITGGYITNNTGYGINNLGATALLAGNENVSSNTAGNLDGLFTSGGFRIQTTYTQSLLPLTLPIYTVATLPAGVNGMRAMVSDSSVTTFNSPVVGGGGAAVPVFYASAWLVG